MKKILILTSIVALVFPLALTGCCRTEIANLKTELETTKSQRDELQTQVGTVTETRDQFKKQVNELVVERGRLEKQVNPKI